MADRAAGERTGLPAAYASCRAINARYGRTYYLATRLLAPDQRPSVHALYGFARYADEIVDRTDGPRPARERTTELDSLAGELAAALASPDATGRPVVVAVADTARRHGLDPGYFEAFLASMRMDTVTCDYRSFAELDHYMYGSAAVIGLQLLPVLGTSVPPAEAEPAAAALGVAFQLTNFVRDVAEDLERGRVYLPADELAAFGVDRALLQWCHRGGRRDRRVRRAMAFQVARARAVYRRAAPGIEQLAPRSRPCVRTAYLLYGGILDEVAAADYDVLGRRATVPTRRRLAVALPQLARAHLNRVRTPSPGRGV